MLETSTRIVQLFLDEMRLEQQNIEQLTDGLSLGFGASPAKLVDWNEYAVLLDRAAEAVGGHRRIADLCESTFVRALPEAQMLMKLAPDVASGAWLINAYADAAFFTHIRYRMARVGTRKFHLKLRIPKRQGHRDSASFFHALTGVARASSALAGMAPSTVRVAIQPFGADYELTLPKLGMSRPADSAEMAEQRVRATFLRNCQTGLRKVRHAFEELHRTELIALERASFSTLSDVVSRALLGRERSVMPIAAVQAIQQVLQCERVAIKLVGVAGKRPTVLAELGPPIRRLQSFETELATGLLVLEADVTNGSPQASALRRLLPWLALLFGASADATPAQSSDWASLRLGELARRWGLTPRQQQVAWLIAQGETNKAIAQALACAEGTVELHAHAVMSKSRLPTRAALAAYFHRGT